MRNTNPHLVSEQSLDAEEIKYVKIVVFDDQNRVLVIKNKNRFVLPGGRIEWDDDDVEAAARREVFETANISLGLVKPVTIIKTRNRQNQSAQTIVFVGRMASEGRTWPEQKQNHRLMSKETFLKTVGVQSDLVRSLIEEAHHVLVSEEIVGECAKTTLVGREKYNFQSLL